MFIGGTGNISSDSTRLALAKGWGVYHLNRGNKPFADERVTTLIADANDPAAVNQVLDKALGNETFDAIVQWVAYTQDQVQRDIELYAGRCRQYVFISSASAYRKPVVHPVISESTALYNPFWQYSRDKAACEAVLDRAWKETGFPVTVVRPSHTYGDGWIPTSFGSGEFTVPARMLAGKEIVVHGDGESLWTLTHTEDFAKGLLGLLGNPAALGEAFHITSDMAYSWNYIHRLTAELLGVEARIVHIPSDFIAAVSPERGAGLLGDKAYSVLFDNSKIKRFVPTYKATITLEEGLRRSVAWFRKRPELMVANEKTNAEIEKVLKAYRHIT